MCRHRDSLSRALKALYPGHPWQLWRFAKSPQKYWKSAPFEEKRKFLEIVAAQLGVKRNAEWYSVKAADLERVVGARSFLLTLYGGSLTTALLELIPQHEWRPWKFDNVARNWWSVIENRRSFFTEIGRSDFRIEMESLDGWYGVKPVDVHKSGGQRLLEGYHSNNLPAALNAAFPEHNWQLWRFEHARVPRGFWGVEANRRAFLDWLGTELKFSRPEHWMKLRRHDVVRLGGSALLEDYFDQSVRILQALF